MAQIAARLLRNLGFLFEAGGEPLKTVGERHQLFAAARLEAHLLGDARSFSATSRKCATLSSGKSWVTATAFRPLPAL